MLTGRSKFKQLRQFVALAALAAALAGCAAGPAKVPAEAPRAVRTGVQPLDRLQVAIVPPERDLQALLMAGDFALAANDLKAASDAYVKAAAISDDPKVASRAVELALAVHDQAGTESAVNRWAALGASPADLASARARVALDTGNTAEAQRQLDLLVSSGAPDAWREFGRIVVTARDAAQAGVLLERIATPQRLPNDATAWLAMSELGENLGRHDYAKRIGDAALARFHDGTTYAWAGQQAFRAGDKAGAKKLFAKAVAKDPKNARLRLAYATLMIQDGDTRGAASLLSVGTQNADTYAMRMSLAARAGDKPALARLYQEIRRRPDAVQTENAFVLGQLAELLGHDEDALDWYAAVGDDDPRIFDASVRSAVVLHQQGKDDDAQEIVAGLQTSYADHPDRLRQAYALEGELNMDGRQFDAAATAYDKALRVKPDDTDMLYGRGLAYAEAGRIDQAVTDFRRVLELKPGDIEASNALGYTLADNGRDLGEAQALIEAARTARPDDPSVADSWGWLKFRQGQLDQAEVTLRGAWAKRKDADIGVHLAEVLWSRGRHDEARKLLNEVRRIDPNNASLEKTERKLNP
ncbi:Tetratricopeptide repeat-containing protein [Luteibacter sp. UNCMF331Sha3.1]|uniref:tetratricopeptide repeat protein n=1 Tax=Luteibacter sp. UNCMF331Sha3.1 TaxID=1502760 RepID=UPI0008C4E940|nr:tetratricopeptide repeat protein [Luteibacter sp. UNCMF331Sha3.1]SEM87486.1 Tetratricopeptide repeat-containing protein [Luteibacter sp. UNCMF331Sha3.1]